MTNNIYRLVQDIFPELQQQNLPDDLTDFATFRDWLNQYYSYLQYVEIKEFYDNGIEYSRIFQQKNVDIGALQQQIVDQVGQYFSSFDEEDDEDFDLDARIEMDEKIEEILFEHIKHVAEQHQLQLLVIVRENPYWMVVPQQEQARLKQIVSCFNQSFNQNGDLNLIVY